ncbi:formylglycine-generating enzyme required for sulfatase activity [Parvibaculum indicum]|uniref:formylglycine-generating enzyme family protein n=1 Tax=Parvibaculum indicum TaxID=562969 RepID=UPI001FE5E80E|nr:formylglycine-generating enzyme family protein [Parvibaculum indicum]NIJ43237.1 formylglycine-generating enzyme required for sulfatase activity [Parvibaculum indicum]
MAALLLAALWFGGAWSTAGMISSATLSCPHETGDRAPHPGMVFVPAGEYRMGGMVYPEEGPSISVAVPGFWMDRTEVTNDEFAEFVAATGYVTRAERGADPRMHPDLPLDMRAPGAVVFIMPNDVNGLGNLSQWWQFVPGANWRHPGGPDTDKEGRGAFPVMNLAYEDALAYAEWKGRELPTEAQWEWAARAADPETHPDEHPSRQPVEANTWQGIFPVINKADDGFVGLAPVGCYKPNALGLYDMIGNAWEWTSSPYASRHDHTPADDFDGGGARGDTAPVARYVIKGGSYLCAPNYCMRYRAAARQPQEIDLPTSHLGFRTVLNAPGPAGSAPQK